MKTQTHIKLAAIAFLVPIFSFAAVSTLAIGTNFKGIVCSVLELINILTPILSTLAFIVFFWGLSKFILSSGSEAEVTKGKTYMFWGILALFILLTFRSIIGLVAGDLGIDSSSSGILLPSATPNAPVCPAN